MLEYKRKQEDDLTKRILEERNREKAEDKAARERIRQQIALVSIQVCGLLVQGKLQPMGPKYRSLIIGMDYGTLNTVIFNQFKNNNQLLITDFSDSIQI